MLRWLALAALVYVQTPAPSFSQTVLRDFDVWDANQDGALSREEVAQAALNPKFHGEDAAALAALHVWLSVNKENPPKLDKTWFMSYKPERLRLAKGTPADEAKKLRKAYAATPGSLQSAFVGDLKRLTKNRATSLFDGDGPAVSDIRQGSLGDCYMLAPLGAMVHRNPDELRNMIRPQGDGYKVVFGDGKTVNVAGPTDAELAMGGSQTSKGLWIRVVEKAYGSRDFVDDQVGPKIARDGLNGGKPGVAGRGFTGHKFTSLPLIGDFKKDVPDADLEKRLTRLRSDIPATLADRRLVLAATPSGRTPTSINGKHAYAVFGYDAASDRITLWNPHGNDFKPKGEEGVENGYARTGGVFSMPHPVFAKAFSRVFFEGKETVANKG